MRIADIVASTAEAAFATDQDGRLVAWNEDAGRLLGHPGSRLLGRRCYEVLGGTDVFGNRFCDTLCPLRTMAGRGEAVSSFELDLKRADGERTRLEVSVLVLAEDEAGRFFVLHLLRLPPWDRRRAVETRDAGPGLTPRELEVLRLLADGLETGQIAEALFISVATVRNHVQHVLNKLDAHSRLEAVAVARRAGVI